MCTTVGPFSVSTEPGFRCPLRGSLAESWANRNEEQWGVTDDEFDARWLKFLIDSLLLKSRVPFPGAASPLAQHILTGRVFPDGSE